MKITIATGPIFPVPAVRGGAVQRLWEGLAREFAKGGHEVTIFAREFPGQASEETVDGIRFVRRGGYAQSTSIKRDLVQCLLYALRTARHVPQGDVVVTNDFWMPAVLPWLKPTAGRIVVNANRFPKKQYWLYSKCAAFAGVSQAVAEAIRKQTPVAADRVAVVPNAIDEAFLRDTKRPRDQKTMSRSEAKTARDGDKGKLKDQESQFAEADGDSASPAEAGGGQTQGLQDDGSTGQEGGDGEHTADGRRAVRILYIGRIHPEKGLGLLADALRLLAARDQETKRPKDQEPEKIRELGAGLQARSTSRSERSGERGAWECLLVGPVKQSEGGGGKRFADELKQKVAGLPVRFDAPVYDPAALAKVYDQADVFVYPSVAETGESFGIAPLEAMARGVVPVVSDLAVFREYLDSGANGVVFDHRSDKASENLAAALRELIDTPETRKRMGVAARQTAERFSPSGIADKYLQLFEKVVSGS